MTEWQEWLAVATFLLVGFFIGRAYQREVSRKPKRGDQYPGW